MLSDILNILAGIVLASAWLATLPDVGSFFSKAAKVLEAFKILIGIVILIVGIMGLFHWGAIVSIFAGLVLLKNSLKSLPLLGDPLSNAANFLAKWDIIIGLVVLAFGIVGLLS